MKRRWILRTNPFSRRVGGSSLQIIFSVLGLQDVTLSLFQRCLTVYELFRQIRPTSVIVPLNAQTPVLFRDPVSILLKALRILKLGHLLAVTMWDLRRRAASPSNHHQPPHQSVNPRHLSLLCCCKHTPNPWHEFGGEPRIYVTTFVYLGLWALKFLVEEL